MATSGRLSSQRPQGINYEPVVKPALNNNEFETKMKGSKSLPDLRGGNTVYSIRQDGEPVSVSSQFFNAITKGDSVEKLFSYTTMSMLTNSYHRDIARAVFISNMAVRSQSSSLSSLSSVDSSESDSDIERK